MKKAFVLVAIAVLMVCITPTAYPSVSAGTMAQDGPDDVFGSFSHQMAVLSTAGTKGTVTGQVSVDTQEPTYLINVTVTLFDSSNGDVLASTTTGNKGSYTLEYDAGSYGIKYELNGYNTVVSDVNIVEDTEVTKNISLKQNQSYFGLDLPHALMIVGGSTAVVLLIFTLFMRMRLSKR